MIHARIDNITDKNIIGYEVGTRAAFDNNHGGDPLWIFLDSDVIKLRIVTSDFLLEPTLFYFDSYGNVQKQVVSGGSSGQVS